MMEYKIEDENTTSFTLGFKFGRRMSSSFFSFKKNK